MKKNYCSRSKTTRTKVFKDFSPPAGGSKNKGFTLIELPVVRKRAFTLIELLVVITVIGILATIVMINITGAQAKSRYAKVISDMESISKAVGLYKLEYKIYPVDGTVNQLPTDAGFLDYLPAWPKTPCDNGYKYEYQDWTINGNSNTTGDGYIGIHFVHDTDNGGNIEASSGRRWVYYYDIHNFTSVTAVKGADINTVSTITCNE